MLWLSSAITHHANRVRANPSGLKVGGHQASSASMVSIMTALWFRHLRPQDRVSVKPHASPVLHAINYLLGELDTSCLLRLREFGGLQSYPSRSKDPDPVDYSTGSVGIGATAPIWGALSRRYVNAAVGDVGTGRQFSLVGDAELDEGAVWEAVLDPAVGELGEVVWVVDLNRQSLDRVVPDMAAEKLQGMFTAAGWQVITLKYGRRLAELFARPGGEELRQRIDAMTNPEYQRLLRCDAGQLRLRLPEGPGTERIRALVAFAIDAEWTLLAGMARLGRPDGSSAYVRLSTRPIDQTLAAVPGDPAARERRRRQVVAGAYPLVRTDAAKVTIAAMGPVVPEALAAADRLAQVGVPADVVCVTSPDLLYRAVRARQGHEQAESWVLDQVFPTERATPLVTVLDGHPHTLAFLATVNRVPVSSLGVTRFGQSGSIEDVYRHHGLDTDSIVRAALDVTA
ncbi:transketolase-like TK C-terminal-containing protein [Streptomyces scabiei]|uniref:transketolase-like TK C-terminal-containing protein n=1 Tax=Streptomyces scabiei TaxID=1930 RepID=UPI001F1B6E91